MGSMRVSIEEKFGTLPYFFIYTLLEWVVIILLFIDGFLAFLSNEIARVFELRIPCLLCTRLDHIVIHRDSNFYYNDSICEVHKRDISTLTYCRVHKKLCDFRSMCRGCLLSFAMEKDSDSDLYKSIVGIVHKDVDYFAEDEKRLLLKPLKKDDMEIACDEKIGVFRCCCCGDLLKSKSTPKFNRNLSMNAPAPSPRAPWFQGRTEEGDNMDLAPHGRYTELKLDNESELHQEEEDASHLDNHAIVAREEAIQVKPVTVPLLPDTEDMNDDAARTPSFTRGNKFFGIPLSDGPPGSPRWGNRTSRKLPSDFLLEPVDLGNESDGDMLTRLKQQVNQDRKSLMALYMELDEERSASAIAANNAMAMITRLQAEKAAVQMEALQYQRMMEEQAEYDQEALQMMKDMVFKREEEIRALESELEMYKEKYGKMRKIRSEICEVDVDDDYQDMHSQALSSFSDQKSDTSGGDQNEKERVMECVGGEGEELSLDFEGEKSYLLGLLREFEKKVNEPSNEVLDSLVSLEDENGGNKAVLTREVSLIRERLRAVEAESGFLKHAAMTLQRGGEGTKLLTEIAQHLRNLRPNPNANSSSEDINASS